MDYRSHRDAKTLEDVGLLTRSARRRAASRAGKLRTQLRLNLTPRGCFQATGQTEIIVLRLISALAAAAVLGGCAVAPWPGYGYPYYDGYGYPYYGYGYPYPYAYGYYPGYATIGIWGGGGYYYRGYWWYGNRYWYGGWHGGGHGGGGWHGGGSDWESGSHGAGMGGMGGHSR
jgi:hypothetical protein